MDDNPLELVLKSKSADELIDNASSNDISVYGWVFLALLLIVIGIVFYRLFKNK